MRLLWAAVVALLAAPAVAAYAEHEAAELWQEQYGTDAVVATRHDPETVRDGEQFTGTLILRPGHNITDVHYQVCIVADQCIISPRPATRADEVTWTFDTADFRLPDALGGHMRHWKADDWIGIQWFLRMEGDEDLHEFPQPWPLESEECIAQPVACQETHYFTFHMAPAEDADAPAIPVAAPLLVVALGALLRRRHA